METNKQEYNNIFIYLRLYSFKYKHNNISN